MPFLKSTGRLCLSEIASFFGGTTPHCLSEYYRGGGRVPSTKPGTGIDESGFLPGLISPSSYTETRYLGLNGDIRTKNTNAPYTVRYERGPLAQVIGPNRSGTPDPGHWYFIYYIRAYIDGVLWRPSGWLSPVNHELRDGYFCTVMYRSPYTKGPEYNYNNGASLQNITNWLLGWHEYYTDSTFSRVRTGVYYTDSIRNQAKTSLIQTMDFYNPTSWWALNKTPHIQQYGLVFGSFRTAVLDSSSIQINTGIPSSGRLCMSQFYGAEKP